MFIASVYGFLLHSANKQYTNGMSRRVVSQKPTDFQRRLLPVISKQLTKKQHETACWSRPDKAKAWPCQWLMEKF
jgi:hypothetical protein